jgi:hypothetical protein
MPRWLILTLATTPPVINSNNPIRMMIFHFFFKRQTLPALLPDENTLANVPNFTNRSTEA